MSYGKSIVLAFILFALFIGTLVTVCIRQEVSLVSPDYYAEELAHGEKMNAMANARLLESKPEITMGSGGIEVRYENLASLESGELNILRPGDQRLDHHFSLQPTAHKMIGFPVEDYMPGLYRIQMKWKMNGKEYLVEQVHTQ